MNAIAARTLVCVTGAIECEFFPTPLLREICRSHHPAGGIVTVCPIPMHMALVLTAPYRCRMIRRNFRPATIHHSCGFSASPFATIIRRRKRCRRRKGGPGAGDRKPHFPEMAHGKNSRAEERRCSTRKKLKSSSRLLRQGGKDLAIP